MRALNPIALNPITKAVAVALVQILLISSLGAKLLYDRKTCPRTWFKTQRYDPNLPIRGRYLSLQVEVQDPRTPEEVAAKFGSEIRAEENQRAKYDPEWHGPIGFGRECGTIAVHDGRAIAAFDESSIGLCEKLNFSRRKAADRTSLLLNEPVLFFIPDTAKDLTHLNVGEELWVLATVPRKGPLRPIALGIKKANEGEIRELKSN